MTSALPVIGAVGGFIIGGPTGAKLGAGIGTILSRTFGADTIEQPTVEGPRLADLRIQTSNYGKSIPEIFGTARLAGNIIWAQEIKEVKKSQTNTQQQGKGGGPSTSQTTNTYEYYATLAIGICEGEITEIVKTWADTEVIDNNFVNGAEGKYNIYLGTEEQLPDPIIESFEGVGNVPAYRGLAYIVIEDLPLLKFGNRIPNFTFEVKRNIRFTPALEDKVTDIVLIPGAGEFVYSTSVYQKITGYYAYGTFNPNGKKESINMHNFEGVANVLPSLDKLQETLPNLEWVALVVTWFGTSTDAGACDVIPKVEYNADTTSTEPYEWEVAGLNRHTAQMVLTLPDGSITYGGTPSDRSIIEICQELKNRGLNIMLYPMIFVDETEPNPKPWRGRITPQSTADANNFFTKVNGYNDYILHYANLQVDSVNLKDLISAIVIGSELRGLTNFTETSGVYPVVDQFVNLASLVKSAVGSSVAVTYAADWSEYHSVNGWFNMDPLWASPDIDFIGIDAYFPLTDDLPQAQITYDKIKQGWESGEGWDYYYLDSANRTGKTNYSDNKYAWKNLEYWWSNTHQNPDGNNTAWVPKSKPVWFTEFGFPSLDGAANQPNVFYDPTSSESHYPRASKGRIDYVAQREALEATIDYLTERNQAESGLTPRAFLWTWDARPYPLWPDFESVWADARLYSSGHWVQGKLGNSTLGAIIAHHLCKVGLLDSDFDVSELTDIVDGYIRMQISTVRQVIEHLQAAYFFDMVESDGILKFKRRGSDAVANIAQDELVPLNKDGNIRDVLQITRTQELELPKEVNISYISRIANYDPSVQRSQRHTVNAIEKVGLNLPIVLNDQQGRNIADITLYNSWIRRTSYSLIIPPKYAYLEPTDIIDVEVQGVTHQIRINKINIERNGLMEVQGVAEDISSYDFYIPVGLSESNEDIGYILPDTKLELIDIPALEEDVDNLGKLRIAVAPLGENWQGAITYRSDDGGVGGGNNFGSISSTDNYSVIGACLNTLSTIHEGNITDIDSEVEVQLIEGELSSVTKAQMLNGSNLALINNELVQFQTASLIGDKYYRLSNFLRGRYGTEHEIANHDIGDRFILLDNSISKIDVVSSLFNSERHYKGVTSGDNIVETQEQPFTYAAKTLKPYSPVNIEVNKSANDFEISWLRRTRLGGDWKDFVDIPLSEESEKYEITILDNGNEIASYQATTSNFTYTEAMQIADFGTAQNNISFNIYQLSAIVGRGYPAHGTSN